MHEMKTKNLEIRNDIIEAQRVQHFKNEYDRMKGDLAGITDVYDKNSYKDKINKVLSELSGVYAESNDEVKKELITKPVRGRPRKVPKTDFTEPETDIPKRGRGRPSGSKSIVRPKRAESSAGAYMSN
jgi:hypothetical protein